MAHLLVARLPSSLPPLPSLVHFVTRKLRKRTNNVPPTFCEKVADANQIGRRRLSPCDQRELHNTGAIKASRRQRVHEQTSYGNAVVVPNDVAKQQPRVFRLTEIVKDHSIGECAQKVFERLKRFLVRRY